MIDWTHWHNEPYLVGGLILLGWFYALFTGPLRSRLSPHTAYPTAHAVKFYLALVLFYLAVGSPLDQIGERFLLTAHMVQHILLIYGSAILFLLGLPTWLVSPITANPGLRPVLQGFARPISCALIYILTLTIWHFPFLYDWALQNKFVHVMEHIMFFGASLFYWWPVLSPSRELPRLGHGAQMIYLLAITIGMTPLFFLLAFSDNVLYPTYEYAPRIVAGFTPMEDQLFGAAVMKLGGILVTFVALVIAFYRWYQESERPSSTSAPRGNSPRP